MQVHSTAIISKKAKLADDIQVGPYTIIKDNVTLDAGIKIGAYCVIEGNTTIGSDCEIFTGAVIGSRPQDLKYKGEKSFLKIGNANTIREYCTFNPGTKDGAKTVVGNNNLFMAYSHVAHDCIVGSNCVFANNATLAGHVIIEDKAVIGGLVAIHQFVRVGMLSIIGGCSKVVQDIPPYSTSDGHPARVYGLNIVGVKRQGMPKETIRILHSAFKLLFQSGFTVTHAKELVVKEIPQIPEVVYLLDFINHSQRGIAHPCRKEHAENAAVA